MNTGRFDEPAAIGNADKSVLQREKSFVERRARVSRALMSDYRAQTILITLLNAQRIHHRGPVTRDIGESSAREQ